MRIRIPKDNKQYIDQLKERGFKEIHNKTRNKNMILLTDVEVNDNVLVESERREFKTFYPNYFSDDYRECHHCHKIFNSRSIQRHIRNIHLK